jgi:hypothetical protein
MTTITIERDTPTDAVPNGFFLGATIKTDDVIDLVILQHGLDAVLTEARGYAEVDPDWNDRITRIEAMLAQLTEGR